MSSPKDPAYACGNLYVAAKKLVEVMASRNLPAALEGEEPHANDFVKGFDALEAAVVQAAPLFEPAGKEPRP